MLYRRQSWAGRLSSLRSSWMTCLLNSTLKLLWFLMARSFLPSIIGHLTLPNLPNLKCPVSGVHSSFNQCKYHWSFMCSLTFATTLFLSAGLSERDDKTEESIRYFDNGYGLWGFNGKRYINKYLSCDLQQYYRQVDKLFYLWFFTRLFIPNSHYPPVQSDSPSRWTLFTTTRIVSEFIPQHPPTMRTPF